MVGNIVRDIAIVVVITMPTHLSIRCTTGASGAGDSIVSGTAVTSATRTEYVCSSCTPD